VTVDAPGLFDGEEIFGADLLDLFSGDRQRSGDLRDAQGAGEKQIAVDKFLESLFLGALADEIGDVDGEKVAGGDEMVHGLHADVVGIDEIGVLPAQRLDGRIGLGAGVARLAVDDGVFAVGFVPDRCDLDALIFQQLEGVQLGLTLMAEPVTDADGVFSEFHARLPG